MNLSRGEAYAIVELPIGADPDSIKASYKRLALKWHPDKHRGANYNEALWKFQQVSKAYKRLITDQDVTSMTPEEMYQLYQRTFHKQQPALQTYSNGCDNAHDDSNDSDDNDTKDTEYGSPEMKRNGDILTEEEKERRRSEKRKAKKKQRKEKKKSEKQIEGGQNQDDVQQSRSSSKINDNLTDKEFKHKKSEIISGSDSENFDTNSAFYSQVITKKKRNSVAVQQNCTEAYHSSPQQSQAVRSDKAPAVTAAQQKHIVPQHSKQEETWDQIDPIVLQSRQLAIQGNEMANIGQYSTAIDLFTDAIKLDPKDFRFFGNRSYCYDRILQFDKALQDAERAISLAPDWPKGYFRKGRALAGMKMYSEAEQSFNHVLKLDSKCDDAVQELNRIRAQQLTDMGFTTEQAEAALLQYQTFPQALDSLLSGLAASNGLSIRQSNCTSAEPTLHHASHTPTPTRHTAQQQQPLHPIPQHHYQQAALKIQYNNGPSLDVKMDPTNPEGLSALWVGNVLPEVSDKKLGQMFSKFGVVTSVRCLPEKFCAFVNFKDKDSAAKALKNLQGTECAGQKLLIKFPDNPVTAGNDVIKKSTVVSSGGTPSNGAKKSSAASNCKSNDKQNTSQQRYRK